MTEYKTVCREARHSNTTVHFGGLFGFMVLKNAELQEFDPNHKDLKYKYRVVFAGNKVKDQNFNVALFEDLGSTVATMEAVKCWDALGSTKGKSVMQADCTQAYIQAKFPDHVPKTWITIPWECLPADVAARAQSLGIGKPVSFWSAPCMATPIPAPIGKCIVRSI